MRGSRRTQPALLLKDRFYFSSNLYLIAQRVTLDTDVDAFVGLQYQRA